MFSKIDRRRSPESLFSQTLSGPIHRAGNSRPHSTDSIDSFRAVCVGKFAIRCSIDSIAVVLARCCRHAPRGADQASSLTRPGSQSWLTRFLNEQVRLEVTSYLVPILLLPLLEIAS